MIIEWDKVGEHYYETGTDHGVLYTMKDDGTYNAGVAWNGLTGVTNSPSGAESNKQYADNIEYLNLISTEEFGATIESYQYPDEFSECNGEVEAVTGVTIGQQPRKRFGFSYRTKIGNDVKNDDLGYKIHLIYNALASPSEQSYTTTNDSPEAVTMSWEISTTPVAVGTIGDKTYKPTSHLVIDSRTTDATKLAALEAKLYGGAEADPTLPSPAEVIAMVAAD